jgi:hypothetical protein
MAAKCFEVSFWSLIEKLSDEVPGKPNIGDSRAFRATATQCKEE